MTDVGRHPKIELMTLSEIKDIKGYVGNFEVTVRGSEPTETEASDPQPETHQLSVGSIVIATGYDVFDPHRKPELGYGQYANVITSLELERRLAEGD